MKLCRGNAILPLLCVGLLTACAGQPQLQEPVGKTSRATGMLPLPKKGSNEIEQLIEEVREEMDNPDQIDGPNFSANDDKPAYKHEIPLVVNERVEFWLTYFAEKDRDRFQRFLDRGEIYRETIEALLIDNNIPKELYYLAMIESGFALHARSHASAVGVWQFIRGTGQRYSLEINSYADERRDPIRATIAAAKYLRDLHNVFQSWYLAMAAYNAGERRIMGAIMRNNSRDFWDLAEKRALPRETMDYVPKFIAASIIGHHPERFGFTINKTKRYPKLVAKTVPSRLRLSDIAKTTGIAASDIKAVNPHLLKEITPPSKANYEIWVPAELEGQFDANQIKLASLSRVRTTTYARSGSHYHRIKRGENLALIAKRYGTTVAELKRLNGLRSSVIQAGTSLKVGGSTRRVASASSRSGGSVHVVKRGDTLFKISKRYNLTMSYLKRINGLRGSRLNVGQKIKLGNVVASQKTSQYRVRRGDNLTTIANKFGTTVAAIKQLNSLRRNRIYAGQILQIVK